MLSSCVVRNESTLLSLFTMMATALSATLYSAKSNFVRFATSRSSAFKGREIATNFTVSISKNFTSAARACAVSDWMCACTYNCSNWERSFSINGAIASSTTMIRLPFVGVSFRSWVQPAIPKPAAATSTRIHKLLFIPRFLFPPRIFLFHNHHCPAEDSIYHHCTANKHPHIIRHLHRQ